MESLYLKSSRLSMVDHDVESCSYSIDKQTRNKAERSDAKSISKMSKSSCKSKSSFTRSLENVKVKKSRETSDSSTNKRKKTKVRWTESDYDKFVKIVRRHGRDFKKMQSVLKDKSKIQIKRFTKVLCKQIHSMPGHPELDILEILEKNITADTIKEKKRKAEERKREKKEKKTKERDLRMKEMEERS